MDEKYKQIGSPAIRAIEECGELIQAISKGERFGWGNHHPDRHESNAQELINEWRDLQETMTELWGDIVANQAINSDRAKLRPGRLSAPL